MLCRDCAFALEPQLARSTSMDFLNRKKKSTLCMVNSSVWKRHEKKDLVHSSCWLDLLCHHVKSWHRNSLVKVESLCFVLCMLEPVMSRSSIMTRFFLSMQKKSSKSETNPPKYPNLMRKAMTEEGTRIFYR